MKISAIVSIADISFRPSWDEIRIQPINMRFASLMFLWDANFFTVGMKKVSVMHTIADSFVHKFISSMNFGILFSIKKMKMNGMRFDEFKCQRTALKF